MQTKSNNLLEDEVNELGDSLTKTLYSFVDKAVDGRHAATILLEAGLINEKFIRNTSIIRDYDLQRKNPLNGVLSIYCNLSVKFDLSIGRVRGIVETRYKK